MINRYGEGVVALAHKKLDNDTFMAIAIMSNADNHKWWRIRHDGSTMDFHIGTFSNIDNIYYEDGEIKEISK